MIRMILMLIIFLNFLFAQKIYVAKLISISSNSLLTFKISGKTFGCAPYGILTLRQILQYKNLNPTCKASINDYFNKHPYALEFVKRQMYIEAFYTLSFHSGSCIIYARGQKSLSYMLLANGLAIMQPNFNNEEFKYLFLDAQNSAKYYKKGIWSSNTLTICAKGMYK